MELVKIELNEKQEPIVSGRELHDKLGIGQHYRDWIKKMLEFGFVEGQDYTPHKFVHPQNKQETLDIIMKLDMAKEICMLQRNEKGKEFRKYFIEVEKEFNSPEKIMARALKIADDTIKIQKTTIEKLEKKIDEDRARVLFAETIEKSSDSILVREMSKILANENINIGQNKLYSMLREWGYILQHSTEPTQRAVEQGLFKINQRLVKSIKGDLLTRTTMITGKGQLFLLDKIKKHISISKA